MKKTIAILLSLFFVCLLVSCGPKTPTNTPEEPAEPPKTLQIVSGVGEARIYADNTTETLVTVDYPYVNLHGEDGEEYPRLKLLLEENYSEAYENRTNFIETHQSYVQKAYLGEIQTPYPYWSLEKAFIRRADTKALSILYDAYAYTGGMHGYYYFNADNYDTVTEKKLTLSDVVTDTKALPGLVWEELLDRYPDVPFDEGVMDDHFSEGAVTWTLENNGITFWFNSYDLTSFAYGRQQVTLTFSEYPDLIKKEYQVAPASYGVQLPGYCNFYYDVDSDGAADTVSWKATGEYEGMYETLTISVNGTEYEFKIYSYDTKITFLTTENKECYLYVQNVMENDYTETQCFRLGKTVEQTGTMYGGMRQHFHQDEELHFTEDVLTNPESFQMAVRTQMASTVTGYREYFAGENGIAETKEPFYHFSEEARLTFTVLRDFSAELYEEISNTAKGTVQIVAGETLTYYATDGERFIYLLLEDGTLCRKEVELREHQMMLDGYYAQDVFEGVVYAG